MRITNVYDNKNKVKNTNVSETLYLIGIMVIGIVGYIVLGTL